MVGVAAACLRCALRLYSLGLNCEATSTCTEVAAGIFLDIRRNSRTDGHCMGVGMIGDICRPGWGNRVVAPGLEVCSRGMTVSELRAHVPTYYGMQKRIVIV